jgi:hypothetical protein
MAASGKVAPAASNDYRLKACISEATPFSLTSGRRRYHLRQKIHAQKKAHFSLYSVQSVKAYLPRVSTTIGGPGNGVSEAALESVCF